MLGSFAKPLVTEPDAKHVRLLRHMRAMLAIIMLVHIVILCLVIAAAANATRVVNYYQTYLSGPLSGPNIAAATTNAMATIAAARNISSTIDAVVTATTQSVGILGAPDSGDKPGDKPGAASGGVAADVAPASTASSPPAANGRALLQIPPDTAVREAATGLLRAMTAKVNEFDAAAPGNFLTWVTATTPGPYIRQILNTARYGESALGAVLAALGTRVDPAMAGPDLVGGNQ